MAVAVVSSTALLGVGSKTSEIQIFPRHVAGADANPLLREEHRLICSAYANLGPRPSKEHRVCLFFPAEEQDLRLVWVDPKDQSAIVQLLERRDIAHEPGPRIYPNDNDMNLSRVITFYGASAFLFRFNLAGNQSLGFALCGPPTVAVKGSIFVTVNESSMEPETSPPSDITPGDFKAVMRRFWKFEFE